MKQTKFKFLLIIFLKIIILSVKADLPKRSLIFVCDVTRSMKDDLRQLREGSSKILETFSGLQEQPFKNYVLSMFRDRGRKLRG